MSIRTEYAELLAARFMSDRSGFMTGNEPPTRQAIIAELLRVPETTFRSPFRLATHFANVGFIGRADIERTAFAFKKVLRGYEDALKRQGNLALEAPADRPNIEVTPAGEAALAAALAKPRSKPRTPQVAPMPGMAPLGAMRKPHRAVADAMKAAPLCECGHGQDSGCAAPATAKQEMKTFWDWKAAGRSINKGEHGKKVVTVRDGKERFEVLFAFEQTETVADVVIRREAKRAANRAKMEAEREAARAARRAVKQAPAAAPRVATAAVKPEPVIKSASIDTAAVASAPIAVAPGPLAALMYRLGRTAANVRRAVDAAIAQACAAYADGYIARQ